MNVILGFDKFFRNSLLLLQFIVTMANILSFPIFVPDDAQEKVIKVVPEDLLSPSSEVAPQNSNVEQETNESRTIQ